MNWCTRYLKTIPQGQKAVYLLFFTFEFWIKNNFQKPVFPAFKMPLTS